MALLGEAPDGVTHQIRVFQLEMKPGSQTPGEVYLFDIGPEDLSTIWETLRDRVGTGTYRIRVRRNDVDGKIYQVAQTTQAVKSLLPPAPIAAAAAPAAPAGDLGAIVVAALDKQAAMFRDMMRELAPKEGGSDITELVTALAALDKLRGRDEAPAAAQDPQDLFRAGLEFAREVGAPGEKSWTDVITSALESPYVAKMIEGLQARIAPASSPAMVAGDSAPRAIAPAAPAIMPTVQKYLIELMDEVGRYAQRGEDVTVASDFVIDNAPPAMLERLVKDDALFAQLQAIPTVQQYHGYFAALRADLTGYMMAGEDPAPDDDAQHDIGEPAGGAGRHQGNPEMDSSQDPAGQDQRRYPVDRRRPGRAPGAEGPRRRNSRTV